MASHAEQWRAVCDQRLAGQATIFADHWSRRLLAQAADQTFPTGFAGQAWIFPDRSCLIATSDAVQTR